ncbi:PREDICTED: F-box/FBD/LRR-repeat protein At5g56420-like [Camelina sativa]|uniref:F-box/FBD/LRR-repeat protein At5g56420-like n=1 Tax=Camelina sativa TaxID=90675 RepID=A0ABM0WAE1_CAMSA|nr:PREDICTED: F-box/FBD/LRR-repeat protein At5g56420-like [Camelina sativa]
MPRRFEPSLLELSPEFISMTLLLHESPVLESFHLTRFFTWTDSEIELWVGYAVSRFVRDLVIHFMADDELCPVILLEVPSTVSFQSLKTLCLDRVGYANEESFVRLISSSPVLENLIVQSCRDDNVDTFTINVPSLLRLWVYNLVHGHDHYNRFVIHSHSLNHLTILDEYGEVNLIGELPELVEATLHLIGTKWNGWESLTFVKRLSLTLDYMDEYPIRCIFFQLVCLEFCGICEDWSKELVHVLQHSPILQILKVDRIQDAGEKVCWIEPSCAPECLLYNLKTFEWTDYDGTKFQKEVAIYILKNARRLVTATISPFSKASLGKQQIFDELEFATRGSRACELTIAL